MAVPDEFVTLGDLFTHAGFVTGFAAGLIVLTLFYIASLVSKSSMGGWGLAFAGVALMVLTLQFEVDPTLLLSFGLLALGGWLVELPDLLRGRLGAVAVKTFGWVLLVVATLSLTNTFEITDEAWVAPGFSFVVLVVGDAVRRLNRPPISEVLGVMFAVSVFGVWATVPETDLVRVLLGISIPLAFATVPVIRAHVAGVGAFALVGVIAWLTVNGGVARPASIIGGWAAFGLLPLIPLVGLHRRPPRKMTMILGLHVVAVFLASRVVGSWESVVAASVGVLVLEVSFVTIMWIMPKRPNVTSAVPSEPGVKSG
jgi:hypothetical protein